MVVVGAGTTTWSRDRELLMDDGTARHDERLGELEARLARLERHLGLTAWRRPVPAPPTEPAPALPPPLPAAAAAEPPGELGRATPPPLPASPPALTPTGEAAEKHLAAQRAREFAARMRAAQTKPRQDLEQLIGQRWAAWIGAVVFVIGMGLLITLAWKRGWLGFITPAARCVLGALFGAALLAAAEFVRRRINALAAVGLNAAGLGVIYLAAYASWAMYQLVSPAAAFGMLAMVALLGIAIAVHARFAAVGVVALVGGYLAPLIIASPNPSPWVMPIHLTVLLGLALGVSWRVGPRFAPVRIAGLIGTLALGLLWVVGSEGLPWTPVLAFAAVVWAMVNAETIASVGSSTRPLDGAVSRENNALIGLVGVTGWALAISIVTVWNHTPNVEWTPAAALALACAALAWRRRPDVRALLGTPQTTGQAVASILAWEALALTAASIGLGWSGWLRLSAWMLLAVAAAVASRRTRLWSLSLYAAVLLAACSARLILVDSWHADELAVGTLTGGLFLTRWMLLAGVLAAAWLAAAALIGTGERPIAPAWRLGLGRAAAVAGVLLLFGLWVHRRAETESLLFVWPLCGAAVFAARRLWPDLGAGLAAFAALLFASVVWFFTFIVRGWGHEPAAVLAHPGLWTALMLSASLLLGGQRGASHPRARNLLLPAAWTASGLLMFLATTAEVSRLAARFVEDRTAREGVVSVWWAALAIGLIVAGFAILKPWPRRVGLGLLGLATLKVVLYDLAEVSLEWRTVSFLALGAVMLGVGVVYGKVAKKLAAKAPAAEPPAPDAPPPETPADPTAPSPS